MLSLMAKELAKEKLENEMTKEEHLKQQQGSREVVEAAKREERSSISQGAEEAVN